MDPLTILAAVDASITAYEHALKLLAQARADGLVSVEEQQARLGRVSDIRSRIGLAASDSGTFSGGPGEG